MACHVTGMAYLPAQNRVGGPRRTVLARARRSRLQVPHPRRVVRPMPTKSASGVPDYGYRFYCVSLERWLSRDWLEENGGLHLYNFCVNNSVGLADWLGLAAGVGDWKTATAVMRSDGEVACDCGKNWNCRVQVVYSKVVACPSPPAGYRLIGAMFSPEPTLSMSCNSTTHEPEAAIDDRKAEPKCLYESIEVISWPLPDGSTKIGHKRGTLPPTHSIRANPIDILHSKAECTDKDGNKKKIGLGL